MQSETASFFKTWHKQTATYILAASIFSLSGALVYFTWKLESISEQVPAILKSVEQTSAQIEPVLDQVVELKDLVPSVLNEVSETRKLVAPILNEIRLTREQIPAILKVTEKTNDTVLRAVEEIKATRPLIPEILSEVKQTREAIPPVLDRADKLVSNVRQAGKEASKGAVSGVLTGIVTAPFEIIGSLGKKIFSFSDEEISKLSDKDVELSKKSVVDVLASDKINQTSEWDNSSNNTKGIIKLLQLKTDNGLKCKVLNMKVWKNTQLFVDKDLNVCLNKKGEWERQTS